MSKISGLPVLVESEIDGSERVPVVRDGQTWQAEISYLAAEAAKRAESAAASIYALSNFRSTLAAAVEDFAVGTPFTTDENGDLEAYIRIAEDPGYERHPDLDPATRAQVERAVMHVPDRAALAALTRNVDRNRPVFLNDGKRAGTFRWDSSDLASKVTSDPAQGMYVPPSSDTSGASGAWVREFTGPICFEWFGAEGNGELEDDALLNAIQAAQGNILQLGGGNFNFSDYPPGLDNVHIVGSPRTTFAHKQIPLFNGVFTGNTEIAIIAFALRYYDEAEARDILDRTSAGWYLIADKPGAHHEAVLAGPVTASGSGSIVLKININDFGLDDTLWTPAGCVVGPDETFCLDGLGFAASVGMKSLTIMGAYSSPETGIIKYDGASWSGISAPYIFAANADGIVSGMVGSGANRQLRLYRDMSAVRGGFNFSNATPTTGPYVAQGNGAILPVAAAFRGSGTTTVGANSYSYMDFKLFDTAGTPIDNPDIPMGFTMMDPAIKPALFPFNVNPGAGRNIWGVFIARRVPATYAL